MIPLEETIKEINIILNKDRDDFRDGYALEYLYKEGLLDIRQLKSLNLRGAGYTIDKIAKELVNNKTKTRGIKTSLARSIYNSAVLKVKYALRNRMTCNKIEFTDREFRRMFYGSI